MRREFNQNYTSLPEDNFGQTDSQGYLPEEMDEMEYQRMGRSERGRGEASPRERAFSDRSFSDRAAADRSDSEQTVSDRPSRSRRREIPDQEDRVDLDSFREAARYQGKRRSETPVVGRFADYSDQKTKSYSTKDWQKTGLMPLILSWGGGMTVGTVCCVILAYFNCFPHCASEPAGPVPENNIAAEEQEKNPQEAAKVAMDMPTVLHSTAPEWQEGILGDIPTWNPELPQKAAAPMSHPITAAEPMMSSSAVPVTEASDFTAMPSPVAGSPADSAMPNVSPMPTIAAKPSMLSNDPVPAPMPQMNTPTNTQTNPQTSFPPIPAAKQASDIYLGTNTLDQMPNTPSAVLPAAEKTAVREESEYGWNHLAAEDTEPAGPALNQEIPPMKNEIARFVPTAVNSSNLPELEKTPELEKSPEMGETQIAARPAAVPKGKFAGYQLPGQSPAGVGNRSVSATAMYSDTGETLR